MIQSGLHITISKEELAVLPLAEYSGEVSVIDSEDQIRDAVADLEHSPIIGFDTETRPSFRRGQQHKVALLQLASPERCYLFRINMTGLHPLLISLLQNPSLLKVGCSIKDDFHSLNRLCPINPAGFVDLQQYVKDYRITDNSLARIYGILFGHRISKGQRLTNWEAERLTPAQINYAAFDAVACIRIYEYLSSGSFDPSSSRYLRVEG